MKEIQISKFKATCLAVLDEVGKTGQPIRITRFGKPVADVIPPKPERRKSWLGCMAGKMEIVGDIEGPISSLDDWTVDAEDGIEEPKKLAKSANPS